MKARLASARDVTLLVQSACDESSIGTDSTHFVASSILIICIYPNR
jgi:hypothetical protein